MPTIDKNKQTVIPISKSNREELVDLKRGNDTYDDVISMLLTTYKNAVEWNKKEWNKKND